MKNISLATNLNNFEARHIQFTNGQANLMEGNIQGGYINIYIYIYINNNKNDKNIKLLNKIEKGH